MYVGAYDAPVRDLASYRLRLEELALLGFRSVGLAIDWEEHPRDLSGEEQRALAGVIGIFTGQFLPPDVFASIIGAFV